MQLPVAFYFTDDQRDADPLDIASSLPQGSGIVFRHYNSEQRAETAILLSKICKNRDLTLLISKTPALAAATKSAGCHIPEYLIQQIPLMKMRFPRLTFTAACHSERSLHLAAACKADAAFLSPIFPTASHPGVSSLGAVRAALIKSRVSLPVYGLGGVNVQNWRQLSSLQFSGFGAISTFEEQTINPMR
ncbi:MAG: thiamine phosphate synthase [Sneathiella sp.]|nr:thiamine phosphate synthase [Sneathiella sp.]